ncbi:putative Amidase signature domain-containing protein [Seiridium cardinale]
MFDTLTTNAVELQRLLQDGQVTSVEIVEQYQDQIDRYDSQVNAFISLAPRDVVLQTAASLDHERRQGRVRSSLHGIPIVLKDCFVTESSLGMDSTAGAYAFIGAKPKRNGAIVQKLIDAGLIILGKTNMTVSSQVANLRRWLTVQELHGMKMIMTPGRSAAGGQTLSPYVGDIEKDEVILGHSSPGGSSTGSAVAIATGFSPLAMGAETIGSIVTPCARAALYALKPTVGIQNATGLYRMTDTFDSPGPMAKSPADLVCLTSILLDRKFESLATEAGHNVKIGFLSPKIWVLGPGMCRQHEGTAEQMIQDYEDIVSLLESKGFKAKYPAELPTAESLSLDGTDAIMPIAFSEFRDIGIPEFIQSFEECAVKDLADLIKFNEENQEKALPPPDTDQDLLIKALESTNSEERLDYLRNGLRGKARHIVDKALADQDLDIIAAPTDSALAIYAAAAGYPSANVPLGQLKYNKRPFGLCLMARANEEEKLLRFMVAYEVAVPPRPIPELKQI